MSDPLKVTFDSLASSHCASAVDVLIRTIKKPDRKLRELAAYALMSRESIRGKIEIIRQFHDLPNELWISLKGSSDSLDQAIEQCLNQGDVRTKTNALDVLRITGGFRHIASVIAAVNQYEDANLAERGEETLRFLVSNLFDRLQLNDLLMLGPPISQSAHAYVLQCLDAACERFAFQANPRLILESILILGDTQHPTVKKALWQSTPACKEMSHSVLESSEHPGVMHLLLSQLGEKLPHPRMLSIIQDRFDLIFVTFMLRQFAKRITVNQQRNLKQIEKFCWINAPDFDLSLIPSALHPALIAMVVASGISQEDKIFIQHWMLRLGSAEGRSAASTLMGRLDENQLQNLVLDSLESEDESVQVWATSQLRESHIPNAISLLVERLDSPEQAVRDTARQELSSFNLSMVMDMSDFLDPLVCQRAAQVMMKINPDAVSELHRELANPMRGKRMKALKATRKMGLHRDLLSAIAPLAYDSDSMIRRTLIEVLSDVPTKDSGAILHHLTFDGNERVREEATAALEQLATTLRLQSHAKNVEARGKHA